MDLRAGSEEARTCECDVSCRWRRIVSSAPPGPGPSCCSGTAAWRWRRRGRRGPRQQKTAMRNGPIHTCRRKKGGCYNYFYFIKKCSSKPDGSILQVQDMDYLTVQPAFCSNWSHWCQTNSKFTFCMQISAKMERGMVRLSARVPIRDDVRKQPLWRGSSISFIKTLWD